MAKDLGLEAILTEVVRRNDERKAEGEEIDVESKQAWDAHANLIRAWLERPTPAPVRRFFAVAADDYLHLDLGLWELFVGWFEKAPDGLDHADAPAGFDADEAITIGGTGDGMRYIVLTWTKDAYATYIWETEGSVTEVGDFTALLKFISAHAAEDACEDDAIEMVNDSKLSDVLEASGLPPWKA